MKTSTIIRSNVPSFSAARPLSPPSVIATLNPHCLSHMPMARRVCRSSSTTRMRRMTTHLPCGADALSAPCQPSLPKKTAFHTIARAVLPCESVHYRISAADQRSVCPLQCIRPVPQPPRHRTANFLLGPRHATRRAIADPRGSICRVRCKQALYSLDHCAFWRSRRPARISRQTGADQCDRLSAAAASVVVADCRAAVEQSSAFRKYLQA
jgi:hypothetical protein